MAFKVYPTYNMVGLPDRKVQEWLEVRRNRGDGFPNHIFTGYVPTDSQPLSLNVSAGDAIIEGYLVISDGAILADVFSAAGTYYVWLQVAINETTLQCTSATFLINTSSTPPEHSCAIATVIRDDTHITSVVDTRLSPPFDLTEGHNHDGTTAGMGPILPGTSVSKATNTVIGTTMLSVADGTGDAKVIAFEEKGAISGVCPLNTSTKIDLSYLQTTLTGISADKVDDKHAVDFLWLDGTKTMTGNLVVQNDIKLDYNAATRNIIFNKSGVEKYKVYAIDAGMYWVDAIADPDRAIMTYTQATGVLNIGDAERHTALSVAGHTVWHAGNMGHTSTLNADLLDTKEATAFVWTTGGNATMTQDLTMDSTSTRSITFSRTSHVFSVKADDNFHLYDSTNAADFLTYTHATNLLGIGRSSATKITFNADPANFLIGAYKVWNAYNDGHSSGLDADQLDTKEATAFVWLTGGNATMTQDLTLDTTATARGFVLSRTGFVYSMKADDNFHLYDSTSAADFLTYNHTTDVMAIGKTTATKITFVADPANFKINTYKVWNEANDGIGSTLNADMVDDKHANVFMYLDGTNSTMLGDITFDYTSGTTLYVGWVKGATWKYWMSGDDSGFNITDGIASRHILDYTQTTNVLALGNAAGTTNILSPTFTKQGSTVWTAANDGIGSTLNADYLDDYHASSFQLVSQKGAVNGYCGLDVNGLVAVSDLPSTINADKVDGYHASSFELDANKGIAYGYCGLDGSANIYTSNLPVGYTKDVANGICPLDSSSNVPMANLWGGVANGVCLLDSLACAHVPGTTVWLHEDADDAIFVADHTVDAHCFRIIRYASTSWHVEVMQGGIFQRII